MKKGCRFALVILLFILLILKRDKDRFEVSGAEFPIKAGGNPAYSNIPLYFIQNNGEVDKRVKFYEKGSGHTALFTKEGVYLSLRGQESPSPHPSPFKGEGIKTRSIINPSPPVGEGKGGGGEVIKLSFIGANKRVEPTGEGPQEGKVNYFIGNDPAKWRTDIPTYQAVVYKDIYPGIDIKFYGSNRQLEYDIIVKPGADPTRVRFSYETYMSPRITKGNENQPLPTSPLSKGEETSSPSLTKEGVRGSWGGFERIEGLRITKEGDLEISLTPLSPPLIRGDIRGVASSPAGGEGKRGRGKIIQKRPYIYQEIDGKRVEITGRFKIQDVITPTPPSPLEGEGKGGGGFIYGFDVASYDKRYPLVIDPVLVYSTYLGGSDIEHGFGIAVDRSGSAYVTGVTYSFNFPIKKPLQRAYSGGIDLFVTKLNPEGTALIYSTYLGGMDQDYGYGIAVDSSGSAYVTGVTNSFNFPTVSPMQPTLGGDYDAFIVKLDPKGRPIYSTYLGGSNKDEGRGIAVDLSDNAYITGNTSSTNLPTASPLQPAFGGGFSDAFVAKIKPDGSALVYSTYLGGSTYPDSGYAIAVDSSGNAYVTGETRSGNFPTKNPLQPKFGAGGGYDAFVSKVDPRGALIYSTYLGGRGHDSGYAIAVDSMGSAVVTGLVSSSNFPKVNPIQSDLNGGADAFVAKINPAGSDLVYSTYLGGSGFEQGSGIAVDSSGNAYITGQTSSTDFPTAMPFQRTSGGGIDAFVVKLDLKGTPIYSTYLGGKGPDYGKAIALDSSGNVYVTGQTASPNLPKAISLQPAFGGASDAFVVKISDALLKGEKNE